MSDIKYENRSRISSLGKKILICLPPRFGLGDAIEYSLAINSIIKSKKYSKVGIAFCGKYLFIFKNIFLFSNIYQYTISSSEIQKYDTIFHITLEIEALKFQKYKRSDIVLEVCKYFKISFVDFKLQKDFKNNFIKKISIFPVSSSIIRSLPINVIEVIKKNFEEKYSIDIFVDDSDYSTHLKKAYINSNITIKNPKSTESLIKEISKIKFGIFIDSGPLHIAKLYQKAGVFIETSVSDNVLLKNNLNIKVVKNKYKSQNCNGPCGLVDLFSFDKTVGCYETNKISFQNIKNLSSFKELQRWNKKQNNTHFMLNPVGCVNKIDIEKVINSINLKLKDC